MSIRRSVAAAGLLALAWGPVQGGEDAKPRPYPVLVQLSGQSAAVTRASCRRVMVGDFFEKLLTDCQAEVYPLDVNFGACEAVALFAGEADGVLGFRMVASHETDAEVVLRVAPELADARTPRRTTAWTIFLVPKTKKKVVVQVRKTGGGAESWVTAAELTPKNYSGGLPCPK